MGVIYNWVFFKYRIVMHGWCLYVNRLLLFVCKLQSQNAWLVNVCMEMTTALVARGVSMDVGRGTLARIAIELAPQGKIFFLYHFVGYSGKSLDRFIYSTGINFFFLI